MTAPRIPTFVIGGYLGAGKTTFINALLTGGMTNVAVVVNDFGDVNIDASLIAQTHADTIELTNGCVCCAIGGSLADTLFTLLDRQTVPSTIIIEASGVADPASVAAYTHISGLSPAGTVVFVDASQFAENHQNQLIRSTLERQVRGAHLLAFAKTDIASAQHIADAQTLVTSLAPNTATVSAPADVLAFLVEAKPSALIQPDTGSHDSFSSRTHHFPQAPSREELVTFLSGLPRSVVRAKGIVELSDGSCVLVQQTGHHRALSAIDATPTGIVLISSE